MMEFFANVTKADSKFNTKGRNVVITLAKSDKFTEYWPRLTKEKAKNSQIFVDWDRWCDSDEEDQAPAVDDGDDYGNEPMPENEPEMGGGAAGGMDMEALMKQMGDMKTNVGAAAAANGGMPDDSDDEDYDEEEEIDCPLKPVQKVSPPVEDPAPAENAPAEGTDSDVDEEV